jgi:hypothetical protein
LHTSPDRFKGPEIAVCCCGGMGDTDAEIPPSLAPSIWLKLRLDWVRDILSFRSSNTGPETFSCIAISLFIARVSPNLILDRDQFVSLFFSVEMLSSKMEGKKE